MGEWEGRGWVVTRCVVCLGGVNFDLTLIDTLRGGGGAGEGEMEAKRGGGSSAHALVYEQGQGVCVQRKKGKGGMGHAVQSVIQTIWSCV